MQMSDSMISAGRRAAPWRKRYRNSPTIGAKTRDGRERLAVLDNTREQSGTGGESSRRFLSPVPFPFRRRADRSRPVLGRRILFQRSEVAFLAALHESLGDGFQFLPA